MDQVNSNFSNFLSLPEELNAKILSNLDRNTQYKVSGTCKALYQGLNKIAESTLQDKEITKLDNGDSASKQLADYYRLYCKVLNSVYNWSLTNELFDNAAILESDAKANPDKITAAAIKLINSLYYDYKSDPPIRPDPSKDSELQVLIEAGAELSRRYELDDLTKCLGVGCSEKTIRLILSKQPFANDVPYFSLSSAIVNRYPEQFISFLIAKVKKKNEIKQGYCNATTGNISAALTNKLPDSIFLKLIEKAEGKILDGVFANWTHHDTLSFSEPVLLALLDIVNIEYSTNVLAGIGNLWKHVFKHNSTLSFAPLKKLIELYLSTKPDSIELNCHYFGEFRNLYDKFWNDDVLLTILKTATPMDTSCLKYAILHKVSPEVVLKIYERVSKESLKYDYRTHSEANGYLFSSGSLTVIQRLVEMGEDPYWDDVEEALRKCLDEQVINALLDGFDKGPWYGYKETAYARFLDQALNSGYSDPIIDRILDKAYSLCDGTIELAIKKERSPEIIEKLRAKEGMKETKET